mmetsp:Transcript_30688/g.82162  ORF Transcript_30688/g.82162 Transcript_30688/m.82162 type:complete len:106 (-) Transcript_30688:1121-1438(-)
MYVQDYEVDKPTTHKGYDLNKLTAKELFDKFGLEKGTIDFIGHALALYDSDFYLSQPALELVDRCKLYGESLARYGLSIPEVVFCFLSSEQIRQVAVSLSVIWSR